MPGIDIFIDSSGARAGAREVNEALNSIIPRARRVKGAFGKLRSTISRVKDSLFSLRTALMGFGAGIVIRDVISTSNAFEQYRKTLSTLEGTQTAAAKKWKELLDFAQDTPFRIGEVMKSYMTMKAYGLDPTIEAMRALGDTAAAFGDKQVFGRIAFALGQINSAGKLMAQDLNQLIQAGINVNEVLSGAFNVTKKDIDKLNDAIASGAVSMKDVYEAFIHYMESRFGGQMSRLMDTLKGQWEVFISYVEQVEDKLMSSGLGKYLAASLRVVNDQIERLKKEGKLDEWAKSVSDAVVRVFERTALGIASIYDTLHPILSDMGDTVKAVWKEFKQLPTWAQEVGVIGAFVLGKKGTATLLGALTILRKLRQWQDEQTKTHPLIASQLLAKAMKPGSGKTYLKSTPLYEEGPSPRPSSQPEEAPGAMEQRVQSAIDKIKQYTSVVNSAFESVSKAKSKLVLDVSDFSSKKGGKNKLEEYKKLIDDLTLKALPEYERRIESIRVKYNLLNEELQKLYDSGAISYSKYAKLSIGLYTRQQEELKKVKQVAKDTSDSMSQFWIGAMRSMQSASSDFFMNIMEGNFKNLLRSFQMMLNRMLADWMAAQLQMALWGQGGKGGLIQKAVGWAVGLAGSFFGAGGAGNMASTSAGAVNMSTGAGWAANADIVSATEGASFDIPWYAQHTGYVGINRGPARYFPKSWISSVPRLHDGLKPGEFPAILRYDEEVRTPEQIRREKEKEKEGTKEVSQTVINVYALDSKGVQDVLYRYAQQMTSSGTVSGFRRF